MLGNYPSVWMVGNLLLMGLLSHMLTRGVVPVVAGLPLIVLYGDRGNFPALVMVMVLGSLIRWFAAFSADPEDPKGGL